MMKKFAKLFLVFILIMQSSIYAHGPGIGFAEEIEKEGDFVYQVVDGNELKITDYLGESDQVIIPNTIAGMNVTIIGASVFQGKGLKEVQLPALLREIGEQAFYDNALEQIELPNGLEIIGKEAFVNNAVTESELIGKGEIEADEEHDPMEKPADESIGIPGEYTVGDTDDKKEKDEEKCKDVEGAKEKDDSDELGDTVTPLPDIQAKSMQNMSADEIDYVLATDDDFSGSEDGEFRYIGLAEYVEIPHVIKEKDVTSYQGMFRETSVKGVKSTNENVTDMSEMFSYSQSTTLDLSNFDTRNVTDMTSMFYGSLVRSLDLSSFDTGNVTNMSGMFFESKGTAIEFGNFDTENVTNMSYMFAFSRAKTLDLSSFDTGNVTVMSAMFFNSQAETLDLSSFDTENVTNMSSIFADSQAETLDLSSFDTGNVTNMNGMFTNSQAKALDLHTFDTKNVTDMGSMFSYSQAETLDLSSFDTENVTNMGSMFSYSQAETLDLSSFDTGNVTNMNGMFTNSQAKALDLHTFDTKNVTDMGSMFSYSQAETLDLRSFDTENVTNMGSMFSYSQADTLVLSNFDTGNVTDMSDMFSYSQADTLDLSNFDTGNVTDMSDMFYGSQAETLDLSNFDTSKVENMGNMFSYSQADTIDLSSFDMENVTNMIGMFTRSQAKTLDLHTFDTRNVTNMGSMFSYSQAETLDLSSFDTGNVTNMSGMFSNSQAKTLDLSSFETENVTNMSSMFANSQAETLDLSSFDTESVKDMSYMFYYSRAERGYARTAEDATRLNDGITSKPSGLTFKVKDMDRYVLATDDDFSGSEDGEFQYIGSAEYVEIPHVIKEKDVTSYQGMFSETSVKGVKSTNENVTDMSEMFSYSQSTTLDLSSFDTSKVENMGSMFAGSQAETLDLSSFDTENVTDMSEMFSNSLAKTLDLLTFDTRNVENMGYMFTNCRATTLDVSSFDTGNVENMGFMFYGSQATTLDLSSFDTGNVTNMYSMFSYSQAEILDLSNFDTENVTNMISMFSNSQAETLDLSSFDTGNVTNMISMFFNSQAETLDLSSFDTGNVTDMSRMFYDSEATTLDLSSFDTRNVTDMSEMFYSSRAKKGYARTVEDAGKLNDEGTSRPDGLTFKVKDEDGYVLATDDDFSGSEDGEFRYIGSEEYVEIPHVIKGEDVTSYRSMFEGTSVKGVKSTNENVTDMSWMFYNSQAKTLDLSSVDTGNVTDMNNMFYLSQAEMLDLSSFDTGNVTNMSYMFYLSQAETLNLGSFDTGSIEAMDYMFSNSQAKTLDLSTFDTRNVTNMRSTFSNSQATTLDLSNFDTSSVTDMSYMFSNSRATTLDLRNFDTGNVMEMQWMFFGNRATTLDLSNFDTSSVTDVSYMFYSSSATSLDLSNFDTSNVTNMKWMFSGSKVTTLDLSSFDTSNVMDMNYMFSNSQAKKGYARTAEDATRLNDENTSRPSGLTFIPMTISFVENGNDTYQKKQATEVLNDFPSVEISEMKYQWTASKEFPKDGDWTAFTSGEIIQKEGVTGDYFLHVQVKLDNNDIIRRTSKAFKLDNTAPTVPEIHGSTVWENSDQQITITAGRDAESGLDTTEYRINGGDWKTYDGAFMISADGETVVEARSFDKAQNESEIVRQTVKIDKVAPQLTLTVDNKNLTNKDVTITTKASDAHSGVKRIRVAEGDWVEAAELEFTVSGNGKYTFEAEDHAGNMVMETIEITHIDKESPIVTLSKNGGSFAKEHKTKVDVTDLGSGVEKVSYQWTEDAEFPTKDFVDLQNGEEITSPPKTGDYYVHVLATDKIGNKTAFTSKVFQIDATKPELTLTASNTRPTNKDVTLTAKASDAHSGVKRIRAEDGDWIEAAELDLTVSENGKYSFKAEDHAGNIVAETIEITQIDKEVPVVTLSKNGGDFAKEHKIKVDVTDEGSGVEKVSYQWTEDVDFPTKDFVDLQNGGEITSPPKTGDYYVQVLATDKAGNKTTFTSKVFQVDATKPKLIVTVDNTKPTNKDVIITAKASDVHSGVKRIRVAEGDWVEADKLELKVSKNSKYTFEAEDHAGNLVAETIEITQIDKEVPVVILSKNGGSFAKEHKTKVDVTDVGSGVEKVSYQWTETAEFPTENFKDLKSGGEITTPTKTGDYYAHVLATDEAGNKTAFTSKVFQVDATNPELIVTVDNTKPTNKDVIITAKASDAHSGVKRIRVKDGDWIEATELELKVSENGKYTFEAEDLAGNIELESIRVTNIDKIAPTAPSISGAREWQNRDQIISITHGTDASGVDRTEYKVGDKGVWTVYELPIEITDEGETTVYARTIDKAGNISDVAKRIIKIDRTAPELSLLGDNPLNLVYGETFKDPGYKVTDNFDENVKVKVVGEVDVKMLGSHDISYIATDHAGNITTITRRVNVNDEEQPVITLLGENPLIIEAGTEYKEPGASADDNVDGDISDHITITGKVDTRKLGVYDIHYNVEDSSGNVALEAIREVHVIAPRESYLELNQAAVLVYPGSLVKINGTNTSIQLPNDLPEGTVLQVNGVEFSSIDYEQAGDIYDFKFTFPEGFEDYQGNFDLTLGIDENMDKQAIYHFNEMNKAWEFIGGNIVEGTISVTVQHFSTYGVLTEKVDPEIPDDSDDSDEKVDPEIPDDSDNADEKVDSEIPGDSDNADEKVDSEIPGDSDNADEKIDPEIPGDSDNADEKVDPEIPGDSDTKVEPENLTKQVNLPKTATNYYNYLFVGLLLLVFATMVWQFGRRKKQYNDRYRN